MHDRLPNTKKLPQHIHESAKQARKADCDVSRREFIALASVFGASAAMAYGMLGLAPPAFAQSVPQMGGTARIQGVIRGMKDPRTFDFATLANTARGWLEYLVKYNNDGTFTPVLLDGWDVSDDAKTYTLRVRSGVTWNTGAPFTAADVANNITRFCDSTFEGNSMASRLGILVDKETGKALDGAIEIVDDLTVRLNLPASDISIIPALSEYPAAIVPQDFDAETMLDNPVGTGPYVPIEYEVGVRVVLERHPTHTWWNAGNGAWLDRVEFIDYGEDPVAWVSAAEADEIDQLYASEGGFIEVFDSFDNWTRHEAATAATILVRPNQKAMVDNKRPYADVRVRQALALAVENATVLELGSAGQGTVAENHHIAPIHPEYSEMEPLKVDSAAALALMEEAGMADFEHELISLDAGFQKDSADAVAAQLRDAGIPVRRTVMPSSTFWNNWAGYPLSTTIWGHRPLAVQVFALAYRSGEPWNESGMENAELDQHVNTALGTPDVGERRALMARVQEIMREEGVIIQPFWRSLYNHSKSNLKGGEIHVSQEMDPTKMYWEA